MAAANSKTRPSGTSDSAAIDGVLKGAPFEKRLVSKTYDGIAIAPLYERNVGARPVFGRTAGAPWRA